MNLQISVWSSLHPRFISVKSRATGANFLRFDRGFNSPVLSDGRFSSASSSDSILAEATPSWSLDMQGLCTSLASVQIVLKDRSAPCPSIRVIGPGWKAVSICTKITNKGQSEISGQSINLECFGLHWETMYNACFSFGHAGLKWWKLICQQLRSRSEGYERRETQTMAKTWGGYG